MLKRFITTSFVILSLCTPLKTIAEPPSAPANTAFQFNFLPLENRKNVQVFAACGIGNLPIGMGAKGDRMCDDNAGGPGGYKDRYVHDGYIPNTVEYLHEQDGDLFHQVLIDYAENWRMEVYISTPKGTAGYTQARPMSAGKNDGHVYAIDPKNQAITGTGTGDPTRVQWRMVVDGVGFSMDMLKNSWSNKPKITEVITSESMTMTHVIDMSNSTYSELFTPARVTNTTNVAGVTPFSYDSNKDAGKTITGGKFRITNYVNNDDPTYEYGGNTPNDFGKNLNWLEYWHGSKHWKPGNSYGYGSGKFTEGSDAGWGN